MIRATHIRTKLAVIVTVPLIGLASLAALVITAGDRTTLAPQTIGGVVLGIVAVSLALVWLGSRWITRPLASLLQHAEEVADAWLPDAVRQILDTPADEELRVPEVPRARIRGRDEVAAVAEVLRSVQASSLALAAEQVMVRRAASESFLNLGRRNQNLLTRQIDFITELERNESDPDTLEGLFRLDHLATRMRRNAESLLLLAGVESPRQWSAPVKLSDVVRAALGEVEDYQRVVIRHLEPAAVLGPVAAEIAHLSAELIENALSFSPPDQQVEIKGRLTVTGYTLAITDNGHGMSSVEIDEANRRLASPEAFAVAPSRYLGHLVAGHLARRLGAAVSLHDSPAGGLTARVEVPMTLLANEELDPRLLANAPPASIAPVADAPAAAEAGPVDVDVAPPPEPALTAPAASMSPVLEEQQTPEPPIERPPAHLASPGADPRLGRGFGGLAVTRPMGPSLHTLAARKARAGAEAAEATTPAGLPRRIPGAQRPDATLDRAVGSTDAAASGEASRSTAEDVYSFLSSFQSGVQRGHDEARADVDGASGPDMRDDR